MAVDWNKLRRVIELGTVEAAKDAGLERFAVTVNVTVLPEPINVPVISVEVVELTAEQAKSLVDSQRTN